VPSYAPCTRKKKKETEGAAPPGETASLIPEEGARRSCCWTQRGKEIQFVEPDTVSGKREARALLKRKGLFVSERGGGGGERE